MAIDITKVSDGVSYPFEYTLELDKTLLDGRLATFESPCSVRGKYLVTKGIVTFDAMVQVSISYQCDRCLKKIDRVIKTDFRAVYTRAGSADSGDYTYLNYLINIDDGVSEEILHSIPNRVICSTDCRGLCPHCGIDLNIDSCNCLKEQEKDFSDSTNPFTKLKNFNNFSGGASNGSTKA